MSNLSLNPDPHMAWIYSYTDERYWDLATQDLRARRDAALRRCNRTMFGIALENDEMKREKQRNDKWRGRA